MKVITQQIERILDEGVGESRSVIVQMKANNTLYGELIKTSSRVVRRRGMSISPRELRPAPASVMKRKTKTQAQRKELSLHAESMSSQVALGRGDRTKQRLVQAGRTNLRPLQTSTFLRESLAKHVGKSKSKRRPVKIFSSFSSAVMELDKDSLFKIADELPQIAGVYPNRTVTLPPVTEVTPDRLPDNVRDNKTSAWGLHAVGALAAWGAYGAEGQNVKVAVLDTGVDNSHPDLDGKLRASDWAEFDFDGNKVSGSSPHDSDKHGTHVAGSIAGMDHSGQWIGVAPQAKIAGVLVLKNGAGTDAQILAGLEWAIDKGVDVINMSLGGLRFSPGVFDTYTQAFMTANMLGIPVVVSIGNEGSQTSGSPGNDFFAFAVGATDSDDRAAGFSGGRTQVIESSRFIDPRELPLVYSKPDVSAPGVAVKSTVPGGSYGTWNGTSMAAPHVAGALALLLSATTIRDVEPSERAFLLQDLLVSSVEELGESGQDHRYGFGRIDVLRAIGYAWELGYGF